MNRFTQSIVIAVAFVFATAASAQPEPWRVQASRVAQDLAAGIESLDEVLHELYENHGAPEFQTAIEEIHHVEEVVIDLANDILTEPYAKLCGDFHHLYNDLVDIRLYLIDLGLERNPEVVRRWNSMVRIYNYQLLPYFRNCGASDATDSLESGDRLIPQL